MKKSILFAAGAIALSGVAMSAPINADTTACMSSVATALESTTLYDAFIPTKFLDDARVVDWKAPYSESDATPVATLVMIEGVARHKSKHDDTDEVTVKCGMDMGVVKGIEIMPGHDVKMKSPLTTN
jgi:hypothetical protein